MKHQQPGMSIWDCPETLEEARRIIEGQHWSRMVLIKANEEMRNALTEIAELKNLPIETARSIAQSAVNGWRNEK